MHAALEKNRREAVVAFPLPTVFEVYVDGCSPLGVVFLVDIYVVVFAFNQCFGRVFNLNPCLAWNDVVFAELGVMHHNLQPVPAFAAVCGNFYLQVMVCISDIRNFYVVPVQLLRDFFAAVDAVLQKTSALDFPAVINAATSGKACNDEWNENFKRTKNYLIGHCKFITDNFNSRGDFLIPNLNNNIIRGSEIYYPPYMWIGIGLNVCGK